VLALCEPDALAQRVGAVNTLVFDDDAVRGTNTDVYGFVKLMDDIAAERVLILGAGGAARAVVAALEGKRITLVARRVRPFEVAGRAYEVRPWEELPSLLRDAELLVDATPRGLTNDVETIDLAHTKAAVLDLVVRRETALTRAAAAAGLRTATGTEMLLHQGAAAFERWVGRPAPVDVMRKALDAALG
jgi:shikimate dehydrogenase